MMHRFLPCVAAVATVTQLSAATAIRVISRDAASCGGGIVRAVPECADEPCADREKTVTWSARDGVADVQVDLGAAPRWRLQAAAQDCWSAAVVFEGAEALSLPILPAARLTAAIAPPKGERAPDALHLRVSSVRNGEFPESAVDCTRSKERWLCEVPATEIDMRFSAEGFVPHYVWGLNAKRGRTSDVGKIQLRRGGSITGRAAIAARGEAAPIIVTLAPEGHSDPAATGLRTITTSANARGFFQFAGIEPGRWTVTATQPGWSPASTKIAVTDGGESVLPSALVLEPLAALEVQLDPPRDPGGAEWNVTLERYLDSAGHVRIAASPATDGVWKMQRLERGMYVVTVATADGAIAHRRGDLVFDGMPPLRIVIDVLSVSGTVTAGGKPIEARLEFTHRLGKSAVMKSADDGTFSGVLPVEAPSRWSVKVRSAAPATTVMINNVDVVARNGAARVDLELPDGEVSGTVVDETGQPLRAMVRARREGRVVAEGSTASDGAFSLRGIATGPMEFQATTRTGEDSGFVPHDVRGATGAPITIVARQKLKVQAQVVTPAGRPYAGAIVRVMRSGRTIVDEVTSPAGRFLVHSPAQDTVAHAIVIAPGYGVAMRTIPLTGDAAARRIVLSPLFGQVWVPANNRWDDWPVIAAAGMPAVGLYSWIEPGTRGPMGGRTINLEPGSYRFCSDYSQRVCVDRVVTSGSQQKIEFPQ